MEVNLEPELVPPGASPLSALWYWWAQFSGLALVALVFGYLLTSFFTHAGPVSIHTQQDLVSKRILVGRSLVFTVRVDRREPCAGVVVDNWTRVVSNTTREQIIVNRPIVTTVVAVTEELRIATALPAAVTPGIWHFVSLLNSHCPTRDVVDQIADFTVEVIAPEYEGK